MARHREEKYSYLFLTNTFIKKELFEQKKKDPSKPKLQNEALIKTDLSVFFDNNTKNPREPCKAIFNPV